MSERATIELSSDIVVEPGQDVIIQGVLDYKFAAFLPDSFLFDDPLDWIVTSFEVHRREQLKTSLPASDMQVSLFHGGRCEPLQTRMTYKLTARPQKRGLKLRCTITGRFAPNPGSTTEMSEPKTPSTLTIRDVRHLFETSPDANVVRDCVRAIGAGVGGVFDAEIKDYQRNKALGRLTTVFDAGRTPRVVTTHHNFRITSVEFTQPYYIDGMFVWSGYNVCSEDGSINVMPGACWFMTLVEAMRGIDCLIEAGGSPRPPFRKDDDVGSRFWALMRHHRDAAPCRDYGDPGHDRSDAVVTRDNT